MEDLHLEALRNEKKYPEERFLAVGNLSEVGYPLVRMLASMGFSAEVCTDGKEALGLLKERGFQGVLCDHSMPGMDGMDLLNEVRANFPEIAFVMIAESGDVRQGVLSMIAGASGYLLKPLQSDAVVASLRQALKRKRIEHTLAKYRVKQGEK
jgi:DNA-binding NtrC family response regulator